MREMGLGSGVFLLAFATAAPAQAAWRPGVVELGTTGDSGYLLRLTLISPKSYWLARTGAWSWVVTPEVMLGRWWDRENNNALWDVGATPVLAARRDYASGSLTLDAGIGVHLLSAVRFEDNNLASAFQFGDHVGIEWRPAWGRWRIGYRFQHLSNASIAPPNDGVEFHILRLGWRF
ncbi:MAG TPA: acyloxyacyl hydrolase [Candidatus Macondimonas sp.]|nr:acyloxyacyl hydrolase [Candidatus Macondimonas sp.]